MPALGSGTQPYLAIESSPLAQAAAATSLPNPACSRSLPHRPQAASSWRSAPLAQLPPAALLRTYGAHGLLLAGGVLAGKLARFACYDDLARLASCARLGAHLLPALFCCDVGHPQRAVGFAVHAPDDIWPGVDLFGGDPYR